MTIMLTFRMSIAPLPQLSFLNSELHTSCTKIHMDRTENILARKRPNQRGAFV